MMKPIIILQLEEELKIEINLSSIGNFFDLKNKNTYKIDKEGEIISLNLFGNKITKIDFIRNFKNLKELDLRNNPIRNFVPLEDLKHIILLGFDDLTINSQSFIDNFLKNEIFDFERHSSKISAVYFHSHDFLFDSPQIINFGGKNNYSIESSSEKSVVISCKSNPNFIEDFFGEDISLVSAIVGENGTGKTSLITKMFNHLIPVSFGNEGVIIFIIEEKEKIKYFSYNLNPKFKISFKNFDAEAEKEPLYGFPIYFSNYLSESKIYKEKSNSLDLSLMSQILADINSEPLKIHNSDFSFSSFKNSQLKRWIKMLSNEKIADTLLNFALPVFNEIVIEFHGDSIINANSVNNFSYKNADYKNRKILEDQTKKALVVLDQINYFFNVITTEKSFRFDHSISDSLIAQLMKIITDTIFNPKKTNLFPSIKNHKDFDDLQFRNDSIEILKLLKNNLYFVDGNNKEYDKEFPFDTIIEFVETFTKLVPNNEYAGQKEGLKVTVNFNSAIIILEIYEKLYFKLENSFRLNNHHFIKFFPNIILSSGEEIIFNLISLLFDSKEKDTNVNLPKILFLDEADLGLHPKWKKMFINTLIKVLPNIFIGMRLQIVFTTHDPLTLSDIPNSNIVYLKKVNGETIVLDDETKPQKSFGANITDLLGDSFFIDNGLIGDFSKDKINSVIDWLMDENRDIKESEYYRRIIDIIDEPLVKYKLREMYFEKFPEDFDKEKDIEKLSKLADKLGYKIQRK